MLESLQRRSSFFQSREAKAGASDGVPRSHWLWAGSLALCVTHCAPPPASPAKDGRSGVAAARATDAPRSLWAVGTRSKQRTQTTLAFMHGHYDDSVRMRQAIVAGKLDDFQRVAGRVADDDWSPRLKAGYVPFVSSMRDVARHARSAASLVTGAMDLGKLGDSCAACHQKFGGPSGALEPTPVEGNIDITMFDHALATDLLWDGLILPSDSSWSMGASIIIEAPPLDSDAPEVATAAEHLRSLAREAVAAEAQQRAEMFGSMLLTCAACHEQAGVSIASSVPEPE